MDQNSSTTHNHDKELIFDEYLDIVEKTVLIFCCFTMTLLVDTLGCLITTPDPQDPTTWEVNTPVIEKLLAQGDMIIALSSTRGDHYTTLRSLLAPYPIETYTLENIILPSNPEYYARVMMYYGLDSDECMYIAMKQSHLDSASTLEIQGKLYTGLI